MRIGVVHSFYGAGQPSGENIIVDAQVRELTASGHQVSLIARHTDDVRTHRIYPFRSAMSVATGYGPSPISSLNEFAPDVIHVHNLFPNWGTRWLRSWGGPIVSTIHNFRPVCAAGTLYRDGAPCHDCITGTPYASLKYRCYRDSTLATLPLAIATAGGVDRNEVIRNSNRIIVLSNSAYDTYSALGVPDNRLCMVPNFVEKQHVTPLVPPMDAPWVFMGRLTVEKGIDRLVQHWPGDRNLDIYGAGPLSDILPRERTGGVRFRGLARHADVSEILMNSKGLIFPSVWAEGSPVIYIEALAAGRPVVALAGNSVADDVEAKGHGTVFRSFADLASALHEADVLWPKYAAEASRQYEDAYSPARWTDKVIAVYEDAIRDLAGAS